jgi:hypothetical protein
MKALFGVLALVIVLADRRLDRQEGAVGDRLRRAQHERRQPGRRARRRAGSDASAAAATALDTGNARQKAATLQEQARDRTTQALRQGAERNRQAEP